MRFTKLSEVFASFCRVRLRFLSGASSHCWILDVSDTVKDAQILIGAGGVAGGGKVDAHCAKGSEPRRPSTPSISSQWASLDARKSKRDGLR